jgi:flagellar biosynthesis protein FlhG
MKNSSKKNQKNNIINLKNKLMEKKMAGALLEAEKLYNGHTRIVSITSGKGGVGKTNIVANLGVSFSRSGKKVLVFDADLGLGNLDILLGIAPKYNLSHVINGEKKINDIIIDGPGGIKILPASSGIHEFTNLTEKQQEKIINEINLIINSFDILLIDTAAGISSDVMYFNTVANEIVVVVSPDPTSITDAYALMKVLWIKYSASRFKLVINQSKNINEAKNVFRQLRLVTDRFMDINLEFLGHIEYDNKVIMSIRHQKAVVELYPESKASQCFKKLAKKIIQLPVSGSFDSKIKNIHNPLNQKNNFEN